MNVATILATILSLVLVTAAASSNSSTALPAPPGHNLNHNETFVRDTTGKSPADVQSVDYIRPGLIQLAYSGLTCSPWICGSNHNETLLPDNR